MTPLGIAVVSGVAARAKRHVVDHAAPCAHGNDELLAADLEPLVQGLQHPGLLAAMPAATLGEGVDPFERRYLLL